MRLLIAFAASALATQVVRPAGAKIGHPSVEQRSFLLHEPYLTSGFGYYGSGRRVVAGFGGGPGYRLGLGDHFSAYVEARRLVYSGTALTANVGFGFRLRFGSWEPMAGLQGAGYAGGRLEVLTSKQPNPPAPTAWAIQARLSLLRFVQFPFTVSTLSFDWGYGSDAGTLATAVNASFIDIGFAL